MLLNVLTKFSCCYNLEFTTKEGYYYLFKYFVIVGMYYIKFYKLQDIL